ncbi:unnamed protein product [Gongylonema pulchrum]|uniref:SEC63 domain-containing protein n=1 Tax=Gongylonema pulchrum TaxID=637853 RepID=A0A183ENC3_9BILA|nr:unnamed protein product [Gongylonema pulchrum]
MLFFQAYISRAFIRSYSLLSESMFIQQNSSRLCRAMFEITLRRGWAQAANATLAMAKCLDRKVWQFQTPLRQLEDLIRAEWITKIERRKLSHYQLYEMSAKELGSMLSCDGEKMYEAVRMLPFMNVDAAIKPITKYGFLLTFFFHFRSLMHLCTTGAIGDFFIIFVSEAEICGSSCC